MSAPSILPGPHPPAAVPPSLSTAPPLGAPERAADPVASPAASPPPPAAVGSLRLTTQEREALVQELNPRLAPVALRLQIEVDAQTGIPVIRLVDTATGDVLRQIPDEAKLKLAQVLAEQLQGHLIDQTL